MSHYFIVDYSNNGDHLGYSKIYIDYINEITGLQFIPNGKTELDARDIQTESGLDICVMYDDPEGFDSKLAMSSHTIRMNLMRIWLSSGAMTMDRHRRMQVVKTLL